MKKKIIIYLLIILIMIFTFNIKSYAVTLPELDISSNNYSDGDRMTLKEVNKIEVGKTLQLYAMLTYGNDLDDPDNADSMGRYVQSANLSSVIWTSNDTNIATVDSKGLVTGISEGTTTITVKYDTYNDATYEITVKPKSETEYTGISFADSELTPQPAMILNKEYGFTIYLYNIPDSEKENIKVTIDNESVAELKGIDLCNWEDGSGKGMIIANAKFLSLGQTKITATLNYNGKSYVDSYNFSVVESMYTLSLSSKGYTNLPSSLNVGDKIQLTATFETYGGSLLPEDVTSNGIIWTSSNEKVATVDSKGLVTGREEGTAIITAKYKVGDETLTATYSIKITDTTKPIVNPGTIGGSDRNSASDDKTVANGVLPRTGVNIAISIIGIIAIILVAIVMYKKYKNYKDIK